MQENPDTKKLLTAGYCGLACKSCSVYIASQEGGDALLKRASKAGMSAEDMRCNGCRSEKTSPYCTKCDIKKCITGKALVWCSECSEYPCILLKEFQASLPHRAEILNSLTIARNYGLDEWELRMEEDFCCAECHTYNSPYAYHCTHCGSPEVNAFSKRHWEIIKDSPERGNVE